MKSNESFKSLVYRAVSNIQKGSVMTYKQVAEKIGRPKAYRAVGTALSKNRDAQKVPCHRVVGSDGKMHGYAFGGDDAKMKKLVNEGVIIQKNRVIF